MAVFDFEQRDCRCEFSLICTGHNILKLFWSAASGQFDPAWTR